MRSINRALRLGFLLLVTLAQPGPTWASSITSAGNWKSFLYAKVANTVNGCTNAKGCLQVNGAPGDGTLPAAATGQTLTLFTLPANGSISNIRVKSTVACVNGSGYMRITDIGVTGTAGHYATGLTYDLEAAVSVTNLLYPTMASRGSPSTDPIAVTVTLATDAGNIEDVADGCAFTVSVESSQIP